VGLKSRGRGRLCRTDPFQTHPCGVEVTIQKNILVHLETFQTHPCGVEVVAFSTIRRTLPLFQTHPCGVEVLDPPDPPPTRHGFRRTLVGLKC